MCGRNSLAGTSCDRRRTTVRGPHGLRAACRQLGLCRCSAEAITKDRQRGAVSKALIRKKRAIELPIDRELSIVMVLVMLEHMALVSY